MDIREQISLPYQEDVRIAEEQYQDAEKRYQSDKKFFGKDACDSGERDSFREDVRVSKAKLKTVENILDLPDLKEALSLLELKRQRKLYELDEDQELPYVKEPIDEEILDDYSFAYKARKLMVEAGFRKVKQIGVNDV